VRGRDSEKMRKWMIKYIVLCTTDNWVNWIRVTNAIDRWIQSMEHARSRVMHRGAACLG